MPRMNLFANLPVPAANGAGAAVDVSNMGATKTIVVGGTFNGSVTIEFANDDVAAVWAPVPAGTFSNNPGRVTVDLACRWMRATMESYKSGAANADVGAPDNTGSTLFVPLSTAPVDISKMPGYKTAVAAGAAIVEISEDGISYSQIFSFQKQGAQSANVIGQFARVSPGSASVWLGAAEPDNDTDGIPWPPFPNPNPVEVIIYARPAPAGSDITGSGTLANPYETFKRAIRDVPGLIPPGYIYTVDITGIGVEPLPEAYEMPAIFAPDTGWISVDFGGNVPQPFFIGASLNIRATPKPIALASAIPAADIVAVTQDPKTGLCTIEVTPSVDRTAAWGGDALQGKFLLIENFSFGAAAIHGSDATHLHVALDFDAYTGSNLSIVEPSAILAPARRIDCLNCPQIAWQGIGFATTSPPFTSISLFHSGGYFPIMNLCDVDQLSTTLVSANYYTHACTFRNYVSGGDGAAFTTVGSLLLDCFYFCAGSAGNVFVSSVMDGCQALTSPPVWAIGAIGCGYPACGWVIVDCLFKNGTDPHGAIWANGNGTFTVQNCRIDNPSGPGILCEGSGYVLLDNVGGTLNGDVGVRVTDGGKVRLINDLTDITGVGGDMQVGTLPVRTWANYLGVAPVKNEFDIADPPVGDETTGAGTGGTSGSRLFTRPWV